MAYTFRPDKTEFIAPRPAITFLLGRLDGELPVKSKHPAASRCEWSFTLEKQRKSERDGNAHQTAVMGHSQLRRSYPRQLGESKLTVMWHSLTWWRDRSSFLPSDTPTQTYGQMCACASMSYGPMRAFDRLEYSRGAEGVIENVECI